MAHNYGVKFKSARERLFDLLSDLRWHTHKEMEAVSGNRYAARLLELKREGYVIESRAIPDGKEHRLKSRQKGPPQPKRVKVFLNEHDAAALTQGKVTPAAQKAVTSALASFRVNKGKL